MKLDLDQIRGLFAIFSENQDITEVTIDTGDGKITLKKAARQAVRHSFSSAGNNVEMAATHAMASSAVKGGNAQQTATTPAQTQPQAESRNNEGVGGAANNGLIPITSPMVGTFYRSPSPTAPAFVEVGDSINPGQTVCIIEAMKLMNDLPAEISGKIVKILVENGTTVEYGQQLMLVDPKG